MPSARRSTSRTRRKTITAVGTAAGAATTLSAPAAAGATNVKVPSVAGFAAGQKLQLEDETATVSNVGTPATATSLASTAAAGDTNVKVASVAGLTAGDTLNVENEPVTVSTVGTAATNTTLAAGTTTAVGLPVPSYTGAHWIWNTPGASTSAAVGTIFVRRDFSLTADQIANLSTAAFRINVDDGYTAWINGTQVASSNVANGWQTSQLVNVKPYLQAGGNVIAVAPNNTSTGAGSMVAALRLDFTSGAPLIIQSDTGWLTTAQTCTDTVANCIVGRPRISRPTTRAAGRPRTSTTRAGSRRLTRARTASPRGTRRSPIRSRRRRTTSRSRA